MRKRERVCARARARLRDAANICEKAGVEGDEHHVRGRKHISLRREEHV